MYKNVASQKVVVYAHDVSTDAPKTGDAGNITARISKDGGAAAQSNDVHPTELDATHMKGLYVFDLLQAESNCDLFAHSAVSSTSNVKIDPVVCFTEPNPSSHVQNIVRSIAGQKTVFVNKDGNDGTGDGLTYDTAYLTLATGIADLVDGGRLMIGYGDFNETADLSAKTGLKIQGTGFATRIYDSIAGTAAGVLEPGVNAVLEGLFVENTNGDATGGGVAIRCNDGKSLFVDRVKTVSNQQGLAVTGQVESVWLSQSRIIGREYGLRFNPDIGQWGNQATCVVADSFLNSIDWNSCTSGSLDINAGFVVVHDSLLIDKNNLFKLFSQESGTVVCTGDTTLTGTGTAFQTDFNDGDQVYIEVDTGTTDASGNTNIKVIDTGQNFLTTVSPGDWFVNQTDGISSRIKVVNTNNSLTLYQTGVTGNSKAYKIISSRVVSGEPAGETSMLLATNGPTVSGVLHYSRPAYYPHGDSGRALSNPAGTCVATGCLAYSMGAGEAANITVYGAGPTFLDSCFVLVSEPAGGSDYKYNVIGAYLGAGCYYDYDLVYIGVAADVFENAIDEFVNASYFAEIVFHRDPNEVEDLYTIHWYKQSPAGGTVPLADTDITGTPQIQVILRYDGSDLVAQTNLTHVAGGLYKYSETTNFVDPGEHYEVIATATIDGTLRTWRRIIGRDEADT